jgi:hypothetical protein
MKNFNEYIGGTRTSQGSLDFLSEEEQLKLIKKNPDNIINIANPSEKVQLFAVKLKPESLYDIDNPYKSVIKYSIQKDCRIINFIENNNYLKRKFNESELEELYLTVIKYCNTIQSQSVEHMQQIVDSISIACSNLSEKKQKKLIKKDENWIKYIHKPSKELQMIAVKRNHLLIQFIKNPSLEIQLESVKQDIKSIFYIKKPDKEVAFYCIKCDPDLLKIKKEQVDYQKLSKNYFQHLPLEVQKMLVEYDVTFTLIIPNLHPSLKTELTNVRNMGVF